MEIPFLLLPLALLGHTVVLAQTAPPAVCPAPAPVVMSGAAPVRSGTAASGPQAALQALLDAGGDIVSNCGPAPYTLTLTLTSPLQVPNRRVVLNELGRLMLSGGGLGGGLTISGGAENRASVLNCTFSGNRGRLRRLDGVDGKHAVLIIGNIATLLFQNLQLLLCLCGLGS